MDNGVTSIVNLPMGGNAMGGNAVQGGFVYLR